MLRRITALGFILVMVSIMALRHPALAYCLCEHKVISMSECAHMQERSSGKDLSCCPRCSAAQEKEDEHKKDCSLAISFDAGFFFWQDNTETPHPPLCFDVPVLFASEYFLPTATVNHQGCIALQNAPPPHPPSSALTGVYRL